MSAVTSVLFAFFVFTCLAVLAPAPRNEVTGDNKMIGALFAAVMGGVVVYLLLEG